MNDLSDACHCLQPVSLDNIQWAYAQTSRLSLSGMPEFDARAYEILLDHELRNAASTPEECLTQYFVLREVMHM